VSDEIALGRRPIANINERVRPREDIRAIVKLMLRHDFRRTAVRNMVNLGTPECVVMTVTGYKTEASSTRTTS
jgi:hypothetical protein